MKIKRNVAPSRTDENARKIEDEKYGRKTRGNNPQVFRRLAGYFGLQAEKIHIKMRKQRENKREENPQNDRERGCMRRKSGGSAETLRTHRLPYRYFCAHLTEQRHRVHHPHEHPDSPHGCHCSAAQPPYPDKIHQIVGHLNKSDGQQRSGQFYQLPENIAPCKVANIVVCSVSFQECPYRNALQKKKKQPV